MCFLTDLLLWVTAVGFQDCRYSANSVPWSIMLSLKNEHFTIIVWTAFLGASCYLSKTNSLITAVCFCIVVDDTSLGVKTIFQFKKWPTLFISCCYFISGKLAGVPLFFFFLSPKQKTTANEANILTLHGFNCFLFIVKQILCTSCQHCTAFFWLSTFHAALPERTHTICYVQCSTNDCWLFKILTCGPKAFCCWVALI